MENNFKEILMSYAISPKKHVRDLMQVIGRNARGIALVVDEKFVLLDVMTDGDVRRSLLEGLSIDSSVEELMSNKLKRSSSVPITAQAPISDDECIELLEHYSIRQLPIIDESGIVVDLMFDHEMFRDSPLRLSDTVNLDGKVYSGNADAVGVIMAGGFGTRLRPLTNDIPKPMLPLNGRPLLDVIVERFEKSGIRKLFISTFYKRNVVEDYFGNGAKHNVNIEYLHEDDPIGTAGALSLMPKVNQPIVMMNGDILTKVDFGKMLEFHKEHGALLTVGVRSYEMKVPFGVMKTSGVEVQTVEEKPTLDFLVNAGVYVLAPEAQALVPDKTRYDMTDLIQEINRMGKKVVAFPIYEYWLDIGQMGDYEKAQRDHALPETTSEK